MWIHLQIKLIKFYGWEERWIGKVNEARAGELKMLVAGESSIDHFFLVFGDHFGFYVQPESIPS